MENVCIRAAVNRAAVNLQSGNPLRDISGALIDETEADKRLGIPVREAVFGLPQDRGITGLIKYEREGVFQVLVPPAIAKEVEARLRALTALNGERMWNVMVNVGPDASGDEPLHLVAQKPSVHGEGLRAIAA